MRKLLNLDGLMMSMSYGDFVTWCLKLDDDDDFVEDVVVGEERVEGWEYKAGCGDGGL